MIRVCCCFCWIFSVNSTSENEIDNSLHNERKLNVRKNTDILVYEYPPPEGQTAKDLKECIEERGMPDPTLESSFWNSTYPPEDMGEWFLFRQTSNSFRMTDDPNIADYFVVNASPVLSTIADVCNGEGHYKRAMHYKKLLDNSKHFKERPLDHIFICQSWNCGPQVHHFLKPFAIKMTYLIHEKVYDWIGIEDFPMENVLVIPYVHHQQIIPFTMLEPTPEFRKHRITFYGSLNRDTPIRSYLKDLKRINLKDVGLNTKNLDRENDSDFNNYHHIMRESTFCLVPEGDTSSSRRLFDAMISGCIPIFVGVEFVRPFEHLIPYDQFSYRLDLDNWQNGKAQSEIDKIWEITTEEVKQKRDLMANYIKYINWRYDDAVFEAIVDNMVHRQHG